ncbi:hypothetical protein [Bacillus alkalisoli]|uniref:hypothetical protein n=1 Tax=Bacillus alkalisoli TaxID=2011008 RepID=UPI0012FF0584|nr:hypothetical protein [Bacillus alkalisoli]
MMYLSKPSVSEIVKKQYLYKLKSVNVYTPLVLVQLMAVLFSLISTSSSGSYSGGVGIMRAHYSVDVVIGFTLVWAFIISFTMATKVYREDDFTFVTNRLTYSLSNILFLVSITIFAAITSILSGHLLNVVASIYHSNKPSIFYHDLDITLKMYLTGIVVTILIMLFVSSIGYFVGVLTQLLPTLKFVLPVVFIGMFMMQLSFIPTIFEFYFQEKIFSLFLLKQLVTVFLLFSATVYLSKRMEVRQ